MSPTADHLVTRRGAGAGEVSTDETAGAGYEYAH
jgi:hypothetical protein